MSLELVYPGVSQQYEQVDEPEPPDLPQPVEEPAGWHVRAGDGQRPFKVKHDEVYTRSQGFWRDLLAIFFANLKYTNEIFTFQAYDAFDGVIAGKVIVKLEKFREWVNEFKRHLGERVLWLFVQPRYGWCDTDAPDTNPYVDDVHFLVATCGGNRHNGLGTVTKHGNKYERVECQRFWDGPNPDCSYELTPHLMIKQVDVGDVGNGIFWRTAGGGDAVVFPLVSDKDICIPYPNIAFYPFPEFDALLDGYLVHVVEYVYQGSKTFVRITAGVLPAGWYLAETMGDGHPVGVPGNDRDYVCHISHPDWPKGCCPPVAGWRQELYMLAKE
jgi:hypothetical protein